MLDAAEPSRGFEFVSGASRVEPGYGTLTRRKGKQIQYEHEPMDGRSIRFMHFIDFYSRFRTAAAAEGPAAADVILRY